MRCHELPYPIREFLGAHVLAAALLEIIHDRAEHLFARFWIGKLVTAHIIEEALRITEDDSKPSQVGGESSFAIVEAGDEGNN